MHEGFFFSVFYQPIYNILVGFLSFLPNHDVGLAVVLTTLLVKTALYPLTKKALISQIKMKELEPKAVALREKHKGNKEAEGRALMELYREANLNPFAGIFAIIIQIPVIFALFYIFSRSGLPSVRTEVLYSFISPPTWTASMLFLGVFHMASKSWFLAIGAGFAQFVQAQLSSPQMAASSSGSSFQQDFAKSMQFQMKFVFPLLIIFVAHSLMAAVALYFLVSNLFSVGQELLLQRHRNSNKV